MSALQDEAIEVNRLRKRAQKILTEVQKIQRDKKEIDAILAKDKGFNLDGKEILDAGCEKYNDEILL